MPALRRLRQEDGEFKASLGYIAKPCLKKKKKKVKMVYFLLCIFYILNSEEGLGQWRIKLYYVR
jgi:hypothetical protein